MRKYAKRVISMLLAIVMVSSLMVTPAFAASTQYPQAGDEITDPSVKNGKVDPGSFEIGSTWKRNQKIWVLKEFLDQDSWPNDHITEAIDRAREYGVAEGFLNGEFDRWGASTVGFTTTFINRFFYESSVKGTKIGNATLGHIQSSKGTSSSSAILKRLEGIKLAGVAGIDNSSGISYNTFSTELGKFSSKVTYPNGVTTDEIYPHVFLSDSYHNQTCEELGYFTESDKRYFTGRYAQAANYLMFAGVLEGFGDGTGLRPNETITRGQLVKLLIALADAIDHGIEVPEEVRVTANLSVSANSTSINYKDWDNGINPTITAVFNGRGSEGDEIEITGQSARLGDLGVLSNSTSARETLEYTKEDVGLPADESAKFYVGQKIKEQIRGTLIAQTGNEREVDTDDAFPTITITNKNPDAALTVTSKVENQQYPETFFYINNPIEIVDGSSDPEAPLEKIQYAIQLNNKTVAIVTDFEEIDNPNDSWLTLTPNKDDGTIIMETTRPGKYTVKVIVTDECGYQDQASKTIVVTGEPQPPTAVISTGGYAFLGRATSVKDASTDPNDDIITWKWSDIKVQKTTEPDDGSDPVTSWETPDAGTFTKKNLQDYTGLKKPNTVDGTLTFTQKGVYQIGLTVTDATGFTDTTYKEIKVIENIPVPNPEIGPENPDPNPDPDDPDDPDTPPDNPDDPDGNGGYPYWDGDTLIVKQNRLFFIDISNSLNPPDSPIKWDQTEWIAIPTGDYDLTDLRLGKDSTVKKHNYLSKEVGEFTITITLHNEYSDKQMIENPTNPDLSARTATIKVKVVPDENPEVAIQLQNAQPNFHDNPSSINIKVMATASSPDDDIINYYDWTLSRDNNNDGVYSSGEVIKSYTKTKKAEIDLPVPFQSGNTSLFQAKVKVTEKFGQPTIQSEITDADYRTAEAQTVFEVNWIPCIQYSMREFAYTDDVLTITPTLKDENVETCTVDWTLWKKNGDSWEEVDPATLTVWDMGLHGGQIQIPVDGYYKLSSRITDAEGHYEDFTSTEIRIYHLPVAVISDDAQYRWDGQMFNFKESRKFTLDGNASYADDSTGPALHEIDRNKDYWQIVPLDGQDSNNIYVMNDLGTGRLASHDSTIFYAGANKFDEQLAILEPGRYLVRYQVTNTYGKKSPLVEQIVTIQEDQPPVITGVIEPVVKRGPEAEGSDVPLSIGNLEIQSLDGDLIDSYKIEVVYDSDNDGSFNDETWETLTEGNGYTVEYTQDGYVRLNVQIIRQYVGDYRFRVTAKESFGQNTLEIVPDTEAKGAEKIFNTEIANVSPSGTFSTRNVAKGDVIFAIGNSSVAKEISNATLDYENEFGDEPDMDVSVEAIEAATKNVFEGTFKVHFMWSHNGNDIDSHLQFYGGNNGHLYYANKKVYGCSLDIDDLVGGTGEWLTLDFDSLPQDVYKIDCYAYGYRGSATTTITLQKTVTTTDRNGQTTTTVTTPVNLTTHVGNHQTVSFGYFLRNGDSWDFYAYNGTVIKGHEEIINAKTLSEVLSDVSWRDEAERFVVYSEDDLISELIPYKLDENKPFVYTDAPTIIQDPLTPWEINEDEPYVINPDEPWQLDPNEPYFLVDDEPYKLDPNEPYLINKDEPWVLDENEPYLYDKSHSEGDTLEDGYVVHYIDGVPHYGTYKEIIFGITRFEDAGILYQYDDAGNKIPNYKLDTNGEKIVNYLTDRNGDKIPNYLLDENGNKVPNYQLDSEGNRIPNYIVDAKTGEKQINYLKDENGNFVPNYKLDENGNRIPIYITVQNGGRIPNYAYDSNGDRIPNPDYSVQLAKLLTENIHLIVLGSDENVEIMSNLVNMLSETKKSLFYYAKDEMGNGLDNVTEFIKQTLRAKVTDTQYVLVGEYLAYTKYFDDYNGDPQWLYDSVNFTNVDWVQLYWKYLTENGETASFDYTDSSIPAAYQEKFEKFKEKMEAFWNDPSVQAQRFVYYHDKDYYDNSLGQNPETGIYNKQADSYIGDWQAKEINIFNQVGLYYIDYQIKDNPVPDKTNNSPDNPFDEYRAWSSNYANDLVNSQGEITNPYAKIYVHRRPIAEYTFAATKGNGGTGTIESVSVSESAYDEDHNDQTSISNYEDDHGITSDPTNGLNLFKWGWKLSSESEWRDGFHYFLSADEGERWINDQLSRLDTNEDIIIYYSVRDVDGPVQTEQLYNTITTYENGKWITKNVSYQAAQGAWSVASVCAVLNSPAKPIAHFTTNAHTYEVGTEIKIKDSSYSPNGDNIAKWQWTITRAEAETEKTTVTYTGAKEQMEETFGEYISNWIDQDLQQNGLGKTNEENTFRIELIVWDDKTTPLKSDPYTVSIIITAANNPPTITPPDKDNPDKPGGDDGGGKTLWGKNNPTIYEYDPYDANEKNPYYTYGGTAQKRGSEYLDWTLILDDPDNHDKYGPANDTTYYEVEFKTDRSAVDSRKNFASVASSKTYPTKKLTAAEALVNSNIAPYTTAQSVNLEWGAYRITTNVTDIPLNGADGKTTTMVTTATEKPLHLYVIPKLDLSGLNYVFNGILNNPEKISPGEDITVNATTNDRSTGARLIFRDGEGNTLTQEMNFVSDNGDGTYSWTATMTIPGNLEEEDLDPGETYKFTVQTYTTYGTQKGEETRQKEGTITLNILPLKLYDFHITGINDPSVEHGSYPMYVKDLAFDESDNIDPITGEGSLTKLGYAFNFTLYSKGLKNDNDTIRIRPTFWGYNTATGQYDLELDMYYRNDDGEYVLATSNPDAPAEEGDNFQIYLKGESGTLLGSLRELTLTKDVRTTEAGAQKWSARYGVPGSAVFVTKGQPLTEENIERDEGEHGVLIMFDIEAMKGGSPKYNYVGKGQWHIERIDEATGAYLNPTKAGKYEDGSVIVIDPNHNSLDNYESRPVWTK